MRRYRINDPSLVNQINYLAQRIAALEAYIASIRIGDEAHIETEITDGNHSGRLSDQYEFGEDAIDGHQARIIARKTVRSYDMDDTGRVGSYHNFVVQDSNGEWLSVSGWVK